MRLFELSHVRTANAFETQVLSTILSFLSVKERVFSERGSEPKVSSKF